MMSSSSTNATPSGATRRTSRVNRAGTWTIASRFAVSPGSGSSRSARLSVSDDSSGNGREMSMASGVSTGSTESAK